MVRYSKKLSILLNKGLKMLNQILIDKKDSVRFLNGEVDVWAKNKAGYHDTIILEVFGARRAFTDLIEFKDAGETEDFKNILRNPRIEKLTLRVHEKELVVEVEERGETSSSTLQINKYE